MIDDQPDRPVSSSDTPLLQLRDLSKTFGRSKALDAVNLELTAGEVHGLLGENGSGKSTLIKVLSGFHVPDPGASLTVAGERVSLPVAPGEFRAHGISFVHQDLALVADLSVVENLRAPEVLAAGRKFVSWRRESQRARDTFAEFGLDIDPEETISRLTPTERALVAIVRAVGEVRSYRRDDQAHRPALLVLDEPTVFLPREGTDLLFALVRSLVADGRTGVLFVSHDLDEVLAHTDVVTVLRDGKVQGTTRTAALSRDELVSMIIGRPAESLVSEVEAEQQPISAQAGSDVSVTGLCGGSVTTLDLSVRRGEVLGLTGLAGSGYDEVLGLIFGATRATGGRITFGERSVQMSRWDPVRAMDAGIAYIPADRAREGSVADLVVLDNVMLPVLSRFLGRFGLRNRAMATRCAELADSYDVRPRDVGLAYGALSGGNQQKALLAKWLQLQPRLVLLAEPTQGVDIGARTHIFSLLAKAASEGAAVICASSDYEQLALICQRVLIVADGRVVDSLEASDVSKGRIADRVLSSPMIAAQQSVRKVAA